MKCSAKIAILVMSMLVTMTAMGGSGMGGGILARMLKDFPHDRVYLTFSGASDLLESEAVPKLQLSKDLYDVLLSEVEFEVAIGNGPIMLEVESEDGSTRHFTLRHLRKMGKGPVFLYLIKEPAGE